MPPEGADPDAQCPVDHKTREKWLEAAKAKNQSTPAHPHSSTSKSTPPAPSLSTGPLTRFSLDTGRWQPVRNPTKLTSAPPRPKLYTLGTDREISTIPRAPLTDPASLNSAERAALPANSEADTGHDRESGNWVYPSQEMFFAAMKRKGHEANPTDMASVVPIHNAVNERAWKEIKQWEQGWGSERCGGPKLVSFAGDSKALTPRARWNTLLGYAEPFDRHDWVIDRCGKHVDYVIDFYSGKAEKGKEDRGLNFYLDVRPKLNSWEGIQMRVARSLGW